MGIFDYEQDKKLQEDLKNLFEGKVRVSKEGLKDFLKKEESAPIEETEVEELNIIEKEPEEKVEVVQTFEEEPIIEAPKFMDRLLDEYEDQSKPTIAKTGDGFLAYGGGGENNSIVEVGNGVGLYKDKDGPRLRLKTLIASGSVTITDNGDIVTIGASVSGTDSWPSVSADYYTKTETYSQTEVDALVSAVSGGESNTASNVGGANEVFKQKTGVDLEFRTLSAGDRISITSGSDVLVIDTILNPTPGPLTYVDFNTSAGDPAYQEGRLFWDTVNKTAAVYTDKSDVILSVGQELYIRGVNKTGSIIPNGTIVEITGAQGNRPTVAPAIASSATDTHVIGWATHEIPVNQEGLITTNGTVADVDTDGYPEGTMLYLSTTSAGQFTSAMPEAPYHNIHVGIVITEHQNVGKILVHILESNTLEDLSNVNGTTPQDGYVLHHNGTYWDAVNLVDAIRTDSNITSQTVAYSATSADDIILCSASNVTLPAATGLENKKFNVKNRSSDTTCEVDVAGGGTIDKATTQTLLGLDNIQVVSDGTEYWIL